MSHHHVLNVIKLLLVSVSVVSFFHLLSIRSAVKGSVHPHLKSLGASVVLKRTLKRLFWNYLLQCVLGEVNL